MSWLSVKEHFVYVSKIYYYYLQIKYSSFILPTESYGLYFGHWWRFRLWSSVFIWLLPQLLETLVIALNKSPLNNILLFSSRVHHYFRKSTTPLIFTTTYSWFSLLIVEACFVHSNLRTMCGNLIVWLQPACSFILVCRYWKHQLLFFRLSEELATQSLTWCLLHLYRWTN